MSECQRKIGDVTLPIEYAADYSDNLVPRSLVDKTYLDSKDNWNLNPKGGLTIVDNTINLGGSLTDRKELPEITTGECNFAIGYNALHSEPVNISEPPKKWFVKKKNRLTRGKTRNIIK